VVFARRSAWLGFSSPLMTSAAWSIFGSAAQVGVAVQRGLDPRFIANQQELETIMRRRASAAPSPP
jgi:predicted Abi (CAAX) family protease